MVYLIIGTHKYGEPLAFEVGSNVRLSRTNDTKVEYPSPERLDRIIRFNFYCEQLRKGKVRPLDDITTFHSQFTSKGEIQHNNWINDIEKRESKQPIYDIHDCYNLGALSRIAQSIPIDSQTLRFRSSDNSIVVVEIMGPNEPKYNRMAHETIQLGKQYGIFVVYDLWRRKGRSGIIEVHLPDDMEKQYGVNSENIPELERLINDSLKEEIIQQSAKRFKGRSKEGIELHKLRLAGPFLVPDRSDPRYLGIVRNVTEFLQRFVSLHDSP